MTRRRISFFVYDLASNPIVRAAALAKFEASRTDVFDQHGLPSSLQ